MNYWLMKADPETDYSIFDLQKDGKTMWDGVHNFQAINNIKLMQPGDKVFIYHSQKQKSIVGMGVVSDKPHLNEADPRTSWTVEIAFDSIFDTPLSLTDIKADPAFSDFLLVRHTRLSVMPVAAPHATLLLNKLRA